MKKIITFILFTFFCGLASLEARIPKINPTWVAAVATAASSAYGYYKKDAIQEKAVETTLHVIDEYAKPEKRDFYTSNLFNGLKKFKPSLLPLMKDHYDKRFFEHIQNETTPLASEQQSLAEYTEVVTPLVNKLPTNTLEFLLEHEPTAQQLFTDSAVNNRLMTARVADCLLSLNKAKYSINFKAELDLKTKYTTCEDKIIAYARENFETLDSDVLARILLKHKNQLQEEFTLRTLQYPDKAYRQRYLTTLCNSQIKPVDKNKSCLGMLVAGAYMNMEKTNPVILKTILEIEPSYASLFTTQIVKHIDKIPAELLKSVLQKTSFDNRHKILNALRDRLTQNDTPGFESVGSNITPVDSRYALTCVYNEHAKWFRAPLSMPSAPKDLSQTEAHLLIKQSQAQMQWNEALSSSEIQDFIHSIHDKEKEEQKNNNITFVHGCSWDWDFKQDLFTQLMVIKYQKNFENYRFLRFNEDFTEDFNDASKHLAFDRNLQQLFRPDVLFMNHGLFSNVNTPGSCTFHYWLSDSDQSLLHARNQSETQELFKKAELESYYSKYETAVKELELLHDNARKSGLLLLISVKPETCDNYIYPTTAGGYLKQMDTDKGKISKTSQAIALLKNDPAALREYVDRAEYGMLLTNRYALNPDKAGKDIKIFPFSLAHGTKEYTAYCTKRDQLINKIKQDIANQQNPALQRDTKMINLLSTVSV